MKKDLEKMVIDLIDSFEENGSTAFLLCHCKDSGDDYGGFAGVPATLSEALYCLLKHGLKLHNENENERHVAFAVLMALKRLLAEDSDEAKFCNYVLYEFNPDDCKAVPNSFDLDSEDCRNCPSFKDCLNDKLVGSGLNVNKESDE